MQSVKGELPDFDDLEELIAESTRTVTASTVEDLDDLDALLEESTAIARAKRAQKQGRKLTAEQRRIIKLFGKASSLTTAEVRRDSPPGWARTLASLVDRGLLARDGDAYSLTRAGYEARVALKGNRHA